MVVPASSLILVNVAILESWLASLRSQELHPAPGIGIPQVRQAALEKDVPGEQHPVRQYEQGEIPVRVCVADHSDDKAHVAEPELRTLFQVLVGVDQAGILVDPGFERAPVIIDSERFLGVQYVLPNEKYPVRFNL